MEFVIFQKDQGVATIRFNRPEVFHSVNQGMAMEIQECLRQCDHDEDVRCIVVIGSGKAFCAGQDLKEVTDPNGPELKSIVRDHYNPMITMMRTIEKPIICAVNGVAAGAGANIALAGDIVLASTSASFVQAFSKIGLIPDSGGTFILPRLVGWARAAGMMMTGEKVNAMDAMQMGMIYKVFDDSTFESQVFEMASMLAKMPTTALGLTKRALNESASSTLTIQLETEEQLQFIAGQTEDFMEGVASFLEKRPPVFKGY